MSLDFYYLPASAPCRAVMLAANAIGVQLNLKYVDMLKGEHLTPEFIKVWNLRRTQSTVRRKMGLCYHNSTNVPILDVTF